uniref:Uncharacterized protein n=1 Tax=Parascaris univalens TaxID=6257 RepID=A0A915CEB7_PARUN
MEIFSKERLWRLMNKPMNFEGVNQCLVAMGRISAFTWRWCLRFVDYWKNIGNDYRTVCVDVIGGCKERPVKATMIATALAALAYAYKTNPTERMRNNAPPLKGYAERINRAPPSHGSCTKFDSQSRSGSCIDLKNSLSGPTPTRAHRLLLLFACTQATV